MAGRSKMGRQGATDEIKSFHKDKPEPYDRERALAGFGDEAIFESAVVVFLREYEAMISTVAQAVARLAYEEIREKAHWVKGGLVYLHAHPSAAAAKALEQAACRGDARAVEAAFTLLKDEVSALRASLTSAL